MRISRFFIDRPIFAGVVSLVFVILGVFSYGRLPVAQYPEIAPPVVNITGQYPGASADVVAATVVNRINGVGSITVFGVRDYSMRVWLDPDRLQSLGLTTGDVVTALQGQNVQVASGVLSQPPVDQPRAFQVAVQTLGRLADPGEFANILVKQTATAVVRLKDVARVELAPLDYTTNAYLDRDPAVALAIFRSPG